MSAFRIAVIGRQVLYTFFAFQIAITASAIETSSSAKRRALSTSGAGCASASASAARFQIVATVSPPPPGLPFQNCAVATFSGVAVAALPIVSTSLRSVAYCALVSAGVGGGRNCDGDDIAQGVIAANCRSVGPANAGKVGCQNGSSPTT